MLRQIPKEIVMENGSVWHPKEGMYLADSELGEIWSEHSQKWLRGIKDSRGYLYVNLQCEEGQHPFFLHRLIYETFQGPIPKGLTINHKKEGAEGKQMNMLSNLEVMSRGDNNRYGTRSARSAASRSKPVNQYTVEGELVKTYSSTREAAINGFDSGAISACCRGKKGFKTHKGYCWSYA